MDIDNLERLAQAAGGEAWQLGQRGVEDRHMCEVMTEKATPSDPTCCPCRDIVCQTWAPDRLVSSVRFDHRKCIAHAAHIAAANPAAVLELIDEVRKLRTSLALQANAAHMGMDAAKRTSSIQLQLAEQARAESSPEVLESERHVNSILSEENERLTSERDGAIEIANKNALDASRWQHIYHGPYVICRVHADGRLENLGGSYVGKYAVDDVMAARAAHLKEGV